MLLLRRKCIKSAEVAGSSTKVLLVLTYNYLTQNTENV